MLKILWFFFVGTVHDGNTEKLTTVGYTIFPYTIGGLYSAFEVSQRCAISTFYLFTVPRSTGFATYTHCTKYGVFVICKSLQNCSYMSYPI